MSVRYCRAAGPSCSTACTCQWADAPGFVASSPAVWAGLTTSTPRRQQREWRATGWVSYQQLTVSASARSVSVFSTSRQGTE